MKRTDLVVIAIVLAAVVVVAGLRTSRVRQAPVAATADTAGPAPSIPLEARATVSIPRMGDIGAGCCRSLSREA